MTEDTADEERDLKVALLNFVIEQILTQGDQVVPLSDRLRTTVREGAQIAVKDGLAEFDLSRAQTVASVLRPELANWQAALRADLTDIVARELKATSDQCVLAVRPLMTLKAELAQQIGKTLQDEIHAIGQAVLNDVRYVADESAKAAVGRALAKDKDFSTTVRSIRSKLDTLHEMVAGLAEGRLISGAIARKPPTDQTDPDEKQPRWRPSPILRIGRWTIPASWIAIAVVASIFVGLASFGIPAWMQSRSHRSQDNATATSGAAPAPEVAQAFHQVEARSAKIADDLDGDVKAAKAMASLLSAPQAAQATALQSEFAGDVEAANSLRKQAHDGQITASLTARDTADLTVMTVLSGDAHEDEASLTRLIARAEASIGKLKRLSDDAASSKAVRQAFIKEALSLLAQAQLTADGVKATLTQVSPPVDHADKLRASLKPLEDQIMTERAKLAPNGPADEASARATLTRAALLLDQANALNAQVNGQTQ